MACGYLPPLEDRKRLTTWQPPSGGERVGYKGPELTTCAGYTVHLPEVIEVAKARAHWVNGSLALVCRDDPPTDDFLDAILAFDHQCSALESWLMTPSKDGGGGS
jgi:hypothetical protein